ncbi:MAG TPA: acetylornithine deacetylase [Alphaproteobacteria bacterium]|nr:acetylornithine deacetylase [Alphaproteobacteria bacterium]
MSGAAHSTAPSDSVALLRRLISFDTTSRNSNLALIEYLRDSLADHGVDSTLYRDAGGGKANLYATCGPADVGGLMLSGHTDVVPVDGQDWSSDPFALREESGLLYGRGACDMKGFIAVALSLLPMLKRHDLRRPVHFAFTFDEEIGCLGARQLAAQLREMPVRPAFCLIGEPTGMHVVNGHKGRLAMRCHVHGKEGHSAMPEQACNAVESAAEIISRLRALARRLREQGPYEAGFEPPYTTVHTGLVQGGTALNIVPRDCSFDFEIRNIPSQDPLGLFEELRRQAIEQLLPEMRKTAPQANIRFEELSRAPGLLPNDDDALLRLALAASGDNIAQKVSFGTEAGLYQGADIPTIVCGPGHIVHAHKPDEYVSLEQIARCEAFVTRLISGICVR